MLPALFRPAACCACRAAAARAASQTPQRRGPHFALIGRPAREPSPGWVDGVCSPLPLTVALLLARHLRSGGGGMTPIELLRDLKALWPGDEADRPSKIHFLNAFPALFVTEYEARPKNKGQLHPSCVRLSQTALGLAEAAAAAAAAAAAGAPAPPAPAPAAGGGATPALQRLARALPPEPSHALSPSLAPAAPDPAAARALLAALPLQWLPTLSPSPCAATWGPLLTDLLQRHGSGPARRLPLKALLRLVQDTALARRLPLPPSLSSHWVTLSPSPSYARLRLLWVEQVSAEELLALGDGKSSGGVVAVELVEEGRTALQEDLEALARMAAQCRARRGAASGSAAAADGVEA